MKIGTAWRAFLAGIGIAAFPLLPVTGWAEESTLLERYRQNNPYLTHLGYAPTAIGLPQGDSRFNVGMLQPPQYQYGLDDRLQIGLSTLIAAHAVDLKYRLTGDGSPHQVSILAGAGISHPDVRYGGMLLWPSYSYFFDRGEGRVGLLNVTAYIGAAGRWLPERTIEDECSYSDYRTICVHRKYYRNPNIFWPGHIGGGGTAGVYLPWRNSKWGWVLEGGGILVPNEDEAADLTAGYLLLAARYKGDGWGVQFGAARPFEKDLNRDFPYLLAIPSVDVRWAW